MAAYVSKLTQKDLKFRGNIRHGRVIYKSACAACHGQKGKGMGILARLIEISMLDFTKSEDIKQISDEKLIQIVCEGQGDYMPSWKGILNDNEITDVAAFVQSLGR